MPSKTINVSVQAYEAMAAAKQPGESFSELALRTFRPTSLLDLAGTLSDAQADEWKRTLAEARRRSVEETDARMRRLGWPESE